MLSATETHLGQMYSRQGRYGLALSSLLTAWNIKILAPTVDLKTLCWTEDKIAVNYNCQLELESALEWSAKARATWDRLAKKNGKVAVQ